MFVFSVRVCVCARIFCACVCMCVLRSFRSLSCLKIQFDQSRDWPAKTVAFHEAVTDQNPDKSTEDKMPQWIRPKWFQKAGMPLEWSDDMTQ